MTKGKFYLHDPLPLKNQSTVHSCILRANNLARNSYTKSWFYSSKNPQFCDFLRWVAMGSEIFSCNSLMQIIERVIVFLIHFLPSFEKIKLPLTYFGYFFNSFSFWEVRCARIFVKRSLLVYDSNVFK